MVVSFGAAWPGNAELKATTKSVKGQGLALLPSKPPRSGFVQVISRREGFITVRIPAQIVTL
jgi:hypothetical protein